MHHLLCSAGIMVKGQLRALGTKQHLKTKFGSGYELTVKLMVTDLAAQTMQLTNFVNSIFPSATIIAENGNSSVVLALCCLCVFFVVSVLFLYLNSVHDPLCSRSGLRMLHEIHTL